MEEELEKAWRVQQMRAVFEAELPGRFARSERVKLQQFIPAHWFASAASECVGMYIAGYFYGAISVAQAYVEALSKYLAEFHQVRVGKDTEERCNRLFKAKIISREFAAAAHAILVDRNDFHHLNKTVEQEYTKLQARAEECVNYLHALESEVFAYTHGTKGNLLLAKPEYWPSGGPGLAQTNLRQLW